MAPDDRRRDVGRLAARLLDPARGLIQIQRANGEPCLPNRSAAALGSSVLQAAEHNHPFIREHGAERESHAYREPLAAGAPFQGALPNPAYPPDELAFDSPDDLERVRQVSDAATISDPLVGRIRPDLDRLDGRGLWIANHFCDLVQIRSSPAGTVVRCHLGPTESRAPA